MRHGISLSVPRQLQRPSISDPYFASVVLLCHFDGANGQTTTIDSSPSAKTMSMVGSTKLDTSVVKYGQSSLNTKDAGGTGEVTTPDSADFALGSLFTVEGYVYFTTAPGSNTYCLVSSWASSQLGWFFGRVSGNIAFYYSTTGSNNLNVGAAWTPTLNTWYHIAADRDASNVIRVYVDGVVKASATVSASFFDSNHALEIGNNIYAATSRLPGYVDEVRITKGVCRYGGAFAPPTASFPNR